ncbi:hypothetical protein V8G54_010636 [Vigna mungo]|uniref:Uncharacterized protein n=1 Tax=Vigna mungo TaxID=3915 RepID=A0AAQ3NX12_VIGMU
MEEGEFLIRFPYWKPINWSDLPDPLTLDQNRGKSGGGDIQAILMILKDSKNDNRGLRRDGSESFVNDNAGGTVGDEGQPGAGRTRVLINGRKRVELLVFERGEPWNWISQAEKFFEVQKVEEEEKMQLVFISMEGYAESWFRFWREKTKNYSWDGLKRAMGIRFGGGTRGTVYEKLSAIRQTGAVEDYVREFEVLVGQTTQIPEESHDSDACREGHRKIVYAIEDGRGIGRASSHELIHRGKRRTGEGPGKRPKEEDKEEALAGPPAKEENGAHGPSARAIVPRKGAQNVDHGRRRGKSWGLSTPKTMKLKGRIGRREVLVLIDSGASHNFISQELVDGQKKKISGCCKRVILELGSIEIVENFYLFKVEGVDVILGIEWLKKLGEVTVDWGKLTMVYRQGGKKITLRGDPTLEHKVVGPEAFLKINNVEAWMMVWELGSIEAQNSNQKYVGLTETQKDEMEKLLGYYDVVFGNAARITLQEGSDPINIRPYRYPHVMKAEIEQQIAEMLRTGVVRPSHNPYSSRVILVKKKDGSWRFCVDYRALNRATVPKKFPIPVIEELLDELKEGTFFSKIDLKAGYHQIRMHEEDIEKTTF